MRISHQHPYHHASAPSARKASSPNANLTGAIRNLEPSNPFLITHKGRDLFLKRVRSPQFKTAPTSFVVEFGAMGAVFREDDPTTQSMAKSGMEVWGHEFAETKKQKRIQRDLAMRAEQLQDRMALLHLFLDHTSNENLRVLRTDSFGLWHAIRIAQEQPQLLAGFNRIVITSPFVALHAEDPLGFKSFYKGQESIFEEIGSGMVALANTPCIFSWVIPRMDVVCDYASTKRGFGKMPANRRSAWIFHRASHRMHLAEDNPDAAIFLEMLPQVLRGKAPTPNPAVYTWGQGDTPLP